MKNKYVVLCAFGFLLLVVLGVCFTFYVNDGKVEYKECYEKSFDQTHLGKVSEYPQDILEKLGITKGVCN